MTRASRVQVRRRFREGQSRSAIGSRALPTFILRNRRWCQNQLPVASPETRCPSTLRRRRSIDLCTRENVWILFFQRYPSMCRAAMKRLLKKTAGFSRGGGAIVEHVLYTSRPNLLWEKRKLKIKSNNSMNRPTGQTRRMLRYIGAPVCLLWWFSLK